MKAAASRRAHLRSSTCQIGSPASVALPVVGIGASLLVTYLEALVSPRGEPDLPAPGAAARRRSSGSRRTRSGLAARYRGCRAAAALPAPRCCPPARRR